jgi:hypothetical protein
MKVHGTKGDGAQKRTHIPKNLDIHHARKEAKQLDKKLLFLA